METLKQCSKCKQQKPATTEYFAARPSRPSGLTSQCRECLREDQVLRRKKNPERVREIQRKSQARRKAANPEKIRAQDRASHARRRAANPEKFRAKQRTIQARYRARHPEKVREDNKRYREENPEKARVALAQWREENPEKVRASARKHRAKHPEKVRAQARASQARRRAEMKAENSEALRERDKLKVQRRKARKLQVPDTLTKAEWENALKCWDGCAYCGVSLSATELTLDHVIPLASPDCPGTTAHNVLPVCKHCNLSKQATPLRDFLERKFGHIHMVNRMEMIAIYFSRLSK